MSMKRKWQNGRTGKRAKRRHDMRKRTRSSCKQCLVDYYVLRQPRFEIGLDLLCPARVPGNVHAFSPLRLHEHRERLTTHACCIKFTRWREVG